MKLISIFSLGIQKLMAPGTSVRSSKEALRLTRLYPGIIYSTAGKRLLLIHCLNIYCIFLCNQWHRNSSSWLEVDWGRARKLGRIWINCKSAGVCIDRALWSWLYKRLQSSRCAKENLRKTIKSSNETEKASDCSWEGGPWRCFGDT